MIVISACLAGINCKYSGENNHDEKIMKLIENEKTILVCPEQLGGLTTPRDTCEIVGGTGEDVLNGNAKVMTSKGVEVTKQFINGAKEAFRIVDMYKATKAITKAQSPSCGNHKIYDGTFSGNFREGDGVFVTMLKEAGVEVTTEKDL